MLVDMCRRMFSNLKIYKGKYLIQEPPKRTISSYIIFCQELRAQQKPTQIISFTKQAGQKWKSLQKQKKEIYQARAKQLSEKNKPILEAYANQYIIPFKKITYANIFMQKYYSSNPGSNIKQKIGEAWEKFRQIDETTKKSYIEEAKRINEEREKTIQKFEIPKKKFKSFASFFRRQQLQNGVGKKKQLSSKEISQLEKKYDSMCKKYEKQLETFAKQNKLQKDKLKKMIEKAEKKNLKEKQKTKAKEEEK